MFDVVCPQCNKTSNGTAKRLVVDSCGHQKCRVCLLLDEEKCQQCKTDKYSADNQPSVIRFESNHTGVITCNGTAKKLEIPPNFSNGNGEKVETGNVKADEPKLSQSRDKKRKRVGVESKRSYQRVVVPNHVTVTTKPLQYKCNICFKQFGTKYHIKYHIFCAGQKKPFQCSVCHKDFVTKSHLDIHMLKHSGNKPHTCSICQKSFFSKSKLNRHSALHSSTNRYICSECGRAFRSKDSLKIHTLIHRGEKPYMCKVCNLNFNNTSNLNKHLISHSKDKLHMCDQCGKRFKLKWALTVHRRSHLRIRPFECNTCSRGFVNNKDLQRHQLIHLDTKAFNCSICMTGFRRKDNLYRHVKNTHPGKTAEPIMSTVKQLIMKPSNKPVDNPNAINVITASPTCRNRKDNAPAKVDSRTGTVINGPLKLAFKTNAFKNSYNIHRNYDYDLFPKVTKSYDLAESVNICQKILSPHSPPPRTVINKPADELASTKICQNILSPYPTRPLHYETSFEHKKHAIIKNIKFKLPPNYTNLRANDNLSDVTPLKPVANVNLDAERSNASKNTYAELKTVTNAVTSVIVNSGLGQEANSLHHWRRRTSQNLTSKIVEN